MSADRSKRPGSAGARGSISNSLSGGVSVSRSESQEANTAAAANRCRSRVLGRWESLKQQAEERRALLQESYQFQVFKRDEKDVMSWIDDKMSFATDEAYRDPTNLQVYASSIS